MKQKQSKTIKAPIKNPINGWLVIDKPYGMVSTHIGNKIKHALHPEKIGHIGTLDPLASGVLVFALGEATKLIPFWKVQSKTYQFNITFGQRRSTDDAEGDVIETSSVLPTSARIKMFLKDFIGTIDQVPPNYSAIQVDGKRSYDRARDGEDFVLKSRKVRIDDLQLLEQLSDEEFVLSVTCGTGTYVRSIARDLATACGSVGYVSALRRTHDDCFCENDALSFDHFMQDKDAFVQEMQSAMDKARASSGKSNVLNAWPVQSQTTFDSGFYPLDHVLTKLPTINVSETALSQLWHGQNVMLSETCLAQYEDDVARRTDGLNDGLNSENDQIKGNSTDADNIDCTEADVDSSTNAIPETIVQVRRAGQLHAIGALEGSTLLPRRLLHV